jgi:hypothetical protein
MMLAFAAFGLLCSAGTGSVLCGAWLLCRYAPVWWSTSDGQRRPSWEERR